MKTIIIFFILSTSNVFGQMFIADTVCKADSIELELAWRQFSKDLLQKDTTNLRNESLKSAACDICLELHESTDDFYVPIDTFLFQAFRKLPNTELWAELGSTRHLFSRNYYSDFQFKNMLNKAGTSTYIYVVKLETNKPVEWQYGYKGGLHYFEFVKIDGQYKFSGFTSR